MQGQHLTRSNRLPDFPGKPHYDILGDRLSYNRSYGKNAVYPQRHHGNAILMFVLISNFLKRIF